MIRVDAVGAVRGTAERVELRLDDGRTLTLALEVVARAGIRGGDEIPEDDLLRLQEEDVGYQVRDAALNLLSYRARSRTELSRRLKRKGFPGELVDRCLAELEGRGLIDDEAFAAAFVRDRVRSKPKGSRLISQELRARGVDPETAGGAIEEVMRGENLSDVELAREAARRWRARTGEEPQRARRRLYGFLSRRGFGTEVIQVVMSERLGSSGSAAE